MYLAGRAAAVVAISETVLMPGQPATGQVKYVPLGGNGYDAPHSAYSCFISHAMDASGGNSSINLQFDPRFTQMISYMRAEVVGVAADTAQRMFIRIDGDEIISDTTFGTYWVGTALSSRLWKPPGVVGTSTQQDTAYMTSQMVNVDGDTHNFTCRVYNFDKRARELTPLPVLMASLPR